MKYAIKCYLHEEAIEDWDEEIQGPVDTEPCYVSLKHFSPDEYGFYDEYELAAIADAAFFDDDSIGEAMYTMVYEQNMECLEVEWIPHPMVDNVDEMISL